MVEVDPTGNLTFTVTNPDAESLVPGKCYYLDISMVPDVAPAT